MNIEITGYLDVVINDKIITSDDKFTVTCTESVTRISPVASFGRNHRGIIAGRDIHINNNVLFPVPIYHCALICAALVAISVGYVFTVFGLFVLFLIGMAVTNDLIRTDKSQSLSNTVYVCPVAITGIIASGSGNVTVKTPRNIDTIRVNGSGDINLTKIHYGIPKLAVVSSGSGDLYLNNNQFEYININSSGSGDVIDFHGRDVYIISSGAGDVYGRVIPGGSYYRRMTGSGLIRLS